MAISRLFIIVSAFTLCEPFSLRGQRCDRKQSRGIFNLCSLLNIQRHNHGDETDFIEMLQDKTFHPTNAALSSTFPISFVVGHELVKRAILLAAIDPMIGILLSGGHGTCKSVLARAIHRLLPPEIERLKNNPYNIDPYSQESEEYLPWRNFTLSAKALNDQNATEETEFVATPFVQIPLNVMEDSLVGAVDLEQSLIKGEPIFSPGLLARAHRGVLYIDDINLLDESVVTILFNVISEGYVHVEREGLSIKYPCRPIIIATFNPEEGEVRRHLVDRFAINISTDDCKLTTEERVTVVCNVLNFSGERTDRMMDGKIINAVDDLRKAYMEEKQLRCSVFLGRQLVDKISMSRDQLRYLCEEASRAGCEGQRAEIFACHIAKAHAALRNRRKVNAEDLQLAVALAIVPRSLFMQDAESLEPNNEQEKIKEQNKGTEEVAPTNATQNQRELDETTRDEVDEKESENSTVEMDLPAEFFFGVNRIPIDPELINFAKRRTKKGKGGKSSVLYNLQRGRFVKAIFPKDRNIKSCQLAVAATLRAAAPYQNLRRQYRDKKSLSSKATLVLIDKEDFRIKRLSKKAGTLVIFVVDASGSMALNRMDCAKGAAISLLTQAYKSRDKICLIAFHGKQAEIIVPTTKSVALTMRRLENLPCGGGSPLSHALSTAMRVGLNSIKVKKDVGRVVLVLVTDGRANVPFCVSMGESFDPSIDPTAAGLTPSKEFLKGEVLTLARRIGSLKDFDMLVIDTEDKYVGTGMAKVLARVAMANYYHIEIANLQNIPSVMKNVVDSFSRDMLTKERNRT